LNSNSIQTFQNTSSFLAGMIIFWPTELTEILGQ
jgi:hypothetical protein